MKNITTDSPNPGTAISTPQQFSVLMEELASSTWTLAAIGVIFEAGLADLLDEPRSLDQLAAGCRALSPERIERCLAVAAVRGIVIAEGGRYQLSPGVRPSLQPAARTGLQGDYRSYLLQPAAYLRAAAQAEPTSGWRHTDPVILQAQGDGSTLFVSALEGHFLSELGDLAGRLERPGARFLDVGTGVGALSIAMCRTFPAIQAVGLDPYEVSLSLARENVTRAGLAERIELRPVRIQELRDEAAFDLAWLPPFFLGDPDEVALALARVHAALRPGGWVLIPSINPFAGEAQRAVWSLVFESWGGPVLQSSEVSALLTGAGFTPRTFAGPSWLSMVAGQR